MRMDTTNNKMINFSIYTLSEGNVGVLMDVGRFKLFSYIFEKDDKGFLLIEQTASICLRDRLRKIKLIFTEINPQYMQIFSLIESVPENERFLLLPYNISLDKTLNHDVILNSKVHEINNKEFNFNIDNKIGSKYYIYCWGDRRTLVGESDKKKRVCRFCGKSHPETSFKQKAHAISESLGNTLLFCNEECDLCNENFSKIKQEFSNAMALFSTFNRVRGKSGVRSLKGQNFSINNKENVIGLKADIEIDTFKHNREFKIDIEEPMLNFSLLNIYKCLCKFAISLIDNKYLGSLSKTISWLHLEQPATKLPHVWVKVTSLYLQPLVGVYIRKDDLNNDLPLFIIRMYIYNYEYIFTFPFVDCEYPGIISKEQCQELFSLHQYIESDYSSNMNINPSVEISMKFQEGTKVVCIDRSEYDNLNEETMASLYPNVSGYIVNNEK